MCRKLNALAQGIPNSDPLFKSLTFKRHFTQPRLHYQIDSINTQNNIWKSRSKAGQNFALLEPQQHQSHFFLTEITIRNIIIVSNNLIYKSLKSTAKYIIIFTISKCGMWIVLAFCMFCDTDRVLCYDLSSSFMVTCFEGVQNRKSTISTTNVQSIPLRSDGISIRF